MKGRVDTILIMMIACLSIFAVAMPVFKRNHNEFKALNQEILLPAVDSTAKRVATEDKNDEAVYTASISGFKKEPVVATGDGRLEQWLIAAGTVVFEATRVATISTPLPAAEGNIENREHAAHLPISPARIFDSVQQTKLRLFESVHATAAGRLTPAGIHPGDPVSKGKTIAFVTDEQYSILDINVSADHINKLRKYMGVEIHTSKYPGERFIGRISSITRQTKNLPGHVTIELMNLPGFELRPGTKVNAKFRFS